MMKRIIALGLMMSFLLTGAASAKTPSAHRILDAANSHSKTIEKSENSGSAAKKVRKGASKGVKKEAKRGARKAHKASRRTHKVAKKAVKKDDGVVSVVPNNPAAPRQ